MTGTYLGSIIGTTAIGAVQVRTADGQNIDIDPELTEWEILQKERLLFLQTRTGDERWINIDQITTIKRIEP